MKAAYEGLIAHTAVPKALEGIKLRDDHTLQEQCRITEIPSPPFQEHARAEYFLKRMRELGLGNAYIESEGNVIGVRKGTARQPTLALSAHLDTVFPEGTVVKVREKDGAFYAPGIGDDGRGLAALLCVLEAINREGLETIGDIIFVATVGEEGLGDLRGAKALFRDHREIDGFISIDELGVERIVTEAIGSRRHRVICSGPGGHSFDDFGQPSAIHAIGRAIAKIADLQAPSDPKTTFTVGVVEGGQAVNAIAAEAAMLLDVRSSDGEQLQNLERTMLGLVNDAVREENERWKSDKISIKIEPLGDRPPGRAAVDAIIVQVASQAIAAVTGGSKISFISSSTDANVAMFHGVPALTIGGGGEGGGGHTLNEWFRPTDSYMGPQSALLIALMLVGLQNGCNPLLSSRERRPPQ